jgi:hypothetical protein
VHFFLKHPDRDDHRQGRCHPDVRNLEQRKYPLLKPAMAWVREMASISILIGCGYITRGKKTPQRYVSGMVTKMLTVVRLWGLRTDTPTTIPAEVKNRVRAQAGLLGRDIEEPIGLD